MGNEESGDLFLVDEDENTDYQADKYLLFRLSREEYGINISSVQSIEEMQKIVHVPDMPHYIRGVINLRGSIIPAMDLRLRFSMDERDYDDRTCIVIVDIDGFFVGLIVDTVSEVAAIEKDSIEPAVDLKSENNIDRYIKGFGKFEDEVKILLDTSRILLRKDIEEISAGAAGMEG